MYGVKRPIDSGSGSGNALLLFGNSSVKRVSEPAVEKKVRVSKLMALATDPEDEQEAKATRAVLAELKQCHQRAEQMLGPFASKRLYSKEALKEMVVTLDILEQSLEYIEKRPMHRAIQWLIDHAPEAYTLPLTEHQRRTNRVHSAMLHYVEATSESKKEVLEWFKDRPEVREILETWDEDWPKIAPVQNPSGAPRQNPNGAQKP